MIQAIKNLNLLQKKGKYNQNNSIKFETKSIKSSFCDYFDAFILVAGDTIVVASFCDYSDAFILVAGDTTVAAKNNKDVAFKNCTPFSTCKTEINDMFIDEANHIYIAMSMFNLIEYSDDYSDKSRSLWHFKRDEVPANNADLSTDHS